MREFEREPLPFRSVVVILLLLFLFFTPLLIFFPLPLKEGRDGRTDRRTDIKRQMAIDREGEEEEGGGKLCGHILYGRMIVGRQAGQASKQAGKQADG